jgi:hypothetical protein
MIAEAKKSYRGVLCSWCGVPIPAPQKAAALREELGCGELDTARSFAARCRLCEYESVYSTREIQDFEGDPPPRLLKRRAANA